jgi:hypothetical protein
VNGAAGSAGAGAQREIPLAAHRVDGVFNDAGPYLVQLAAVRLDVGQVLSAVAETGRAYRS